jgi:tRNA-guanine family transglycosylase
MVGELSESFRKGSFIMLDSGIFESYWKGDRSWDFDKYRKSVSRIDSDFYFSFDVLPNPKSSEVRFQRSTVLQVEKSSLISKTSEFIPIVHGRSSKELVSTVKALLNAQPKSRRLVAVPERDCGRSLVERAKTILQIRQTLDEKDNSIVLHILGCGNPISLALFAYCGADTFDSLNWTRMAINRIDLKLTELAHLELLNCGCEACSKGIADPISRALLHNLLFYQDFVLRIQNMIRRETLWDFLVEYVGLNLLNRVTDL